MTWQGIYQRRFPRANYKCLIRVSKPNEQDKTIETLTENIGAGGICVALENSFQLFDKVSLEVFLGEGEEPILCDGTVVWVVKRHSPDQSIPEEYDTGIEFVNLPKETIEHIANLVQNLLSSKP